MGWLLLLLFLSAVKAEEKVNSFHSVIEIAADGTLTVVETIDINVEGNQIKRGILRDFPTDYRDRLGRSVTVPFEPVSVKRDGASEPYSSSRQANGVSLRIGNASVMLPLGRHVYEITYRTRWQVGFFEKHDELYWNVNGNGWTFPMDQVSADVFLPKPVPPAELRVEAYTGPFGARDRNYKAETRDGGAGFRTTRRMGVAEGLTIVFMFPKGIVVPPTFRQKFDRWLKDNRGEAIGLAGLLVFLSFLYWRWAAVGRDPRAGPPFPRYEAPRGLGPAGVRYLDKMRCDDRCFASALLGIAQRGFLTIRNEAGSYQLARTGKELAWLPGESSVAVLAPQTGVRAIGGTYDPLVQAARANLDTALQTHYGEKLFSRNSGSLVVGALLGVAAVGLMHLLNAALPVVIGAGVLVLAALVLAAKLLPAYTEEGRRLEDEVEGLRQYLSVAEADDLARQKRTPRTPEEFAKFLPYAVALEVEHTWADAFAKVLGASALAAATASYYSSGDHNSPSFSSADFTKSIENMGRTISAASTPPASSSGSSGSGGSSSSGGGGGSSGGGGGGGGGSGW